MDYLDLVPVFELSLSVHCPRNDFLVALDGDERRAESERFE